MAMAPPLGFIRRQLTTGILYSGSDTQQQGLYYLGLLLMILLPSPCQFPEVVSIAQSMGTFIEVTRRPAVMT